MLMRTKAQKARDLAERSLGSEQRVALQLLSPWTAVMGPSAALVGFLLVQARLPLLLTLLATFSLLFWLAARAEYSVLLTLDSEGQLKLVRRNVISGKVATTSVAPEDVTFAPPPALGLRTATVRGRSYRVRPVFDAEMRSIGCSAAT